MTVSAGETGLRLLLASPLHIHRAEDEFFVVLSGEVRVQHGDAAVAGSIVYGPRDVAHAFHVDSGSNGLIRRQILWFEHRIAD